MAVLAVSRDVRRTGERYRRQVLDLRPTDAETDAFGFHSADRADRDCDLLAAPQVTFLKQHMRDVVIRWLNNQALNPAYIAVSRMHVIAAADLDLIQRHGVI